MKNACTGTHIILIVLCPLYNVDFVLKPVKYECLPFWQR